MIQDFVTEALTCMKSGQSMLYVNTSGERRLVEAVRRVGWLWPKPGQPAVKYGVPQAVFETAARADRKQHPTGFASRGLVHPAELLATRDALARATAASDDEDDENRKSVLAIEAVLNAAGLPTFTWDLHDGYQPPVGYPSQSAGVARGELGEALRVLGAFPKADGLEYPFPRDDTECVLPTRCLVVVKDADTHLTSVDRPGFRRAVRSLYEDDRLVCQHPQTRRHVFFCQPYLNPPESIRHCLVRLPFEPPSEGEIETVIAETQQAITDPERRTCDPDLKSELVQALRGLEHAAVVTAVSRCVVEFGGFVREAEIVDPLTGGKTVRRMVPTVRGVRSRMLSAGQGMRIYDPDDPEITCLGELSGYENVRELADDVILCRRKDAREARLVAPSGFGLAGPPGSGKTVCGKLFSRWIGVPLVVMNMGTTKDQWMGSSEANMARNLATIRALGPSVVLFDEWDKQAGGLTSGLATENTSGAMLSLVLDFASDPRREAFLIFTMNRLHGPVESLRAGRISDFFYTPMPGAEERAEIMRLKLAEQGAAAPEDLDGVAAEGRLEGFSGAELTEVVNKACRRVFGRTGKKAPTAADLLEASARVTPVNKLKPDEVKAMEDFRNVAVPVSRPRVRSKPIGGQRRNINTDGSA